jgi:hypothetical protein
VADFGTHHGAPIQIRNMDDCLQQDVIYNEHHTRRELRRAFLAYLVNMIGCIYALSASIAIGVSIRHVEMPTIQPLWNKLLQLTALLTPAIVVTYVISLVAIRTGRKSSKG